MSVNDQAYSKAAVDRMMQGVMQILSNTSLLIMEQRITDGASTREQVIDVYRAVARASDNPVTKAFYETMAEHAGEPFDPGKARPTFTVIPGGKDEER